MERTAKRQGPQRARPAVGKRYPVSYRLTRDAKDRLVAASKISGRSLAQELEYRIERSLLEDYSRRSEFGGSKTYAISRLIATTIHGIEIWYERTWHDDPWCFEQAVAAINVILSSFRPVGDVNPPEGLRVRDVGAASALGALDLVRLASTPSVPSKNIHPAQNMAEAPLLREELGDLIGRLK